MSARLMVLAVAIVASEDVEYTGYVVDNYCWNLPNHRGIDGSQLGTAPETHILHCLWQVPACKEQGYVILEKLASAAPDGSTYGPKYQLDATGNTLALQLFQQEQTRGGDRAFDEEVTIKGTAIGSDISVSSLCITPKAKNPSGESFCLHASTTTAMMSSGSTSSGSNSSESTSSGSTTIGPATGDSTTGGSATGGASTSAPTTSLSLAVPSGPGFIATVVLIASTAWNGGIPAVAYLGA